MSEIQTQSGKITQVIGPVVDVEFPPGSLPGIYTAQVVTLKQFLPVETGPAEAAASVDFLFEPTRKELLADLVPRHLDVQVWRALLDSAASEHGARMTAMEAATKNASEMIAALSLQYNRARQAYITKELMEIVSGAEALK